MRELWIQWPRALLIMLIGKATKASQYLISLDKTYEGTIRLGIETDSQDADGEVVAEKPVPDGLSEDTVRSEMDGFLGDQYPDPTHVFGQENRWRATLQDGSQGKDRGA